MLKPIAHVRYLTYLCINREDTFLTFNNNINLKITMYEFKFSFINNLQNVAEWDRL